MKREIIVICGPTAVGKTEYAIDTALRMNGEIVSCDSMQLYKYMDIGSAKPTVEEQARVRHYLVDQIDPAEAFSAAKYQTLAKAAIEEILPKGRPLSSQGALVFTSMHFSTTWISARRRETTLTEISCIRKRRNLAPRIPPKTAPYRFERCRKNSSQQHQKVVRAFRSSRRRGEGQRFFERSNANPGL